MDHRALRFSQISESIFSLMSRKAHEKKALNVAQGFPDFNGPRLLIDRMHFHLDHCPNQYTRPYGHTTLCQALSKSSACNLPRNYDALDEITIVNGATEGIVCTVLGLVNPGKDILVFEPYYESYLGAAKMAGATLAGVPLLPPMSDEESEEGIWHINWPRFEQALANCALIILNHPHNPTGKVFANDELETIFEAAQKNDIPVAIDGVYENLVFSPHRIRFMPFLEKYSENIIFISAISKTLSFTGFKIGWVLAPKKFMRGIRAVHETAVYCQAPHMQLAVADVLNDEKNYASYIAQFQTDFQSKRDHMRHTLIRFGFSVPNAQGTYFLMAQKHKTPLTSTTDSSMATELLDNYHVATIPVSGFYTKEPILKDWLRFAFCKEHKTLDTLASLLG